MAVRDQSETGRTGIPISLTLAVGLGTLVTVAVLTVLAIGLWSARTNTLALLGDQAKLAISSSTMQIRQHLAPAARQAASIAAMIEDGRIDLGDRSQFTGVLYGAMGTAPQIRGLVFIDTSFQLYGASRGPGGLRTYTADYSRDNAVRDAVADTSRRGGPWWGPPVWRPAYKTTLLNLRQPVRRDGRFLGMLVALVSISELSENLANLADALGENAYILYDRSRVMAHRRLRGGYDSLSEDNPLPRIDTFEDRVLSQIWQEDRRRPLQVSLPEGLEAFQLDTGTGR